MQAGGPTARNELLRHACERLRCLTRKMLKGFARVKRWELTDDVQQGVLQHVIGQLPAFDAGKALEHFAGEATQPLAGVPQQLVPCRRAPRLHPVDPNLQLLDLPGCPAQTQGPSCTRIPTTWLPRPAASSA